MSTYQIIYNGVMLTIDKPVATAQFARLFHMSLDRAAAILAKPGTVLRSHLDSTTAEMYREKLQVIGLDVEVRDISMQKKKPAIFRAVEEETHIATEAMELVPLEERTAGSGAAAAYRGNRILAFDFYGTGSGYFRIWISNVFLCLLTLGIYFPWALVRARQYFYSNTELEASPFQCVAKPVQILQLWMVLAGWLFLYSGLRYVSGVDTRIPIGALALLPAITVLFFSCQLTAVSWRNVVVILERDFIAAYRIMLFPLSLCALVLLKLSTQLSALASLILLVGFPYWHFALNRFRISRTVFAGRHFLCGSGVGSYYALYFFKLPVLVSIMGIVIFVLFFVALGGSLLEQLHTMQAWVLAPNHIVHAQSHYLVTALVVVLLSATGILWLFAYLKSCLFNLFYDGLSLDKNVMSSRMASWPLLWLYLGNAVAIVFSAGLFIPWAQARLLRYRLSCLVLHASYDLDDIVLSAQTLTDKPLLCGSPDLR